MCGFVSGGTGFSGVIEKILATTISQDPSSNGPAMKGGAPGQEAGTLRSITVGKGLSGAVENAAPGHLDALAKLIHCM